MKLFESTSVGFNVTVQLLIRFSAFVRYCRKYGSIVRQSFIFIDFKKTYESFEEGSIVQYSHIVWGTHEISTADSSVFKSNP
jgi:hypothetical protein